MTKVISSLKVRDLKVGMIIEGSGEIVSIGYSKGFVIKTAHDSITLDGNQRFDIAIIVPDDFIRWDDQVFDGCKRIKTDDCTLDQNTGNWTISKPDGYYLITGFYGNSIFDNWPGVGYSTVAYSMKCYVENNKIYRPGDREDSILSSDYNECWNNKILHQDTWFSIGK